MKTHEIRAALRQRYCAPEWAIFFEVANGTGAHIRRYADAIAMNLFPSRGLEVHGFEIKTYRSDWVKELKNPEKAEAIFKYCDRWWVVAADDVVRAGEVPVTWGHIVAADGKLRQVKAAPELEPQPLTRQFMAACLRRASEAEDAEIQAIVDKKINDIRETERKRADEEIQRRARKFDEFQDRVVKLKERTGIDLLSWQATDEVADAIKFVLATDICSMYSGVKNLRRQAEQLVKTIDEALPK